MMSLRTSVVLLGFICEILVVLKADVATTTNVEDLETIQNLTCPLSSLQFAVVCTCKDYDCEFCAKASIKLFDESSLRYWPACVKVRLMPENMSAKVVARFGENQAIDKTVTEENTSIDEDCFNPPDFDRELCIRLHDVVFTDEFAQVCVDAFSRLKLKDAPSEIDMILGCIRANKTEKADFYFF